MGESRTESKSADYSPAIAALSGHRPLLTALPTRPPPKSDQTGPAALAAGAGVDVQLLWLFQPFQGFAQMSVILLPHSVPGSSWILI